MKLKHIAYTFIALALVALVFLLAEPSSTHLAAIDTKSCVDAATKTHRIVAPGRVITEETIRSVCSLAAVRVERNPTTFDQLTVIVGRAQASCLLGLSEMSHTLLNVQAEVGDPEVSPRVVEELVKPLMTVVCPDI